MFENTTNIINVLIAAFKTGWIFSNGTPVDTHESLFNGFSKSFNSNFVFNCSLHKKIKLKDQGGHGMVRFFQFESWWKSLLNNFAFPSCYKVETIQFIQHILVFVLEETKITWTSYKAHQNMWTKNYWPYDTTAYITLEFQLDFPAFGGVRYDYMPQFVNLVSSQQGTFNENYDSTHILKPTVKLYASPAVTGMQSL